MERRSVVAVVLGVVSVACATGVLEPVSGDSTVLVEPLGEEGERARIAGVVRHSNTRHALGGALVIIQCTCLEGAREAVTDAGGVYAFRNVPPGRYTVQVLHRDANVNKTIELPAGARLRVNFSVDPDRRFIIT